MSASQRLNGLTYHLRTFGCQMSFHDSERIAGMLESLGALPVSGAEQAELVVFMTCCVREKADERLLGQVASLKNLPQPGLAPRIIAVGGCIGQRDGARLIEQLPHIDIVFGTHNLAALPDLVQAVLAGEGHQVELLACECQPATSLPSRRSQAWHAWLPIMTGCNNFCSYCIVPYVRGREKSRPFPDIMAELERLLAEGVVEVTLLGQNVNSYGRDLYGQPRFADLLVAVGQSGLARLRFTTSHPKDLSPQSIEAFAHTAAVMPHLHLPVQSGSNRVLAAMNRHYSVEHYLGLVHELRAACAMSGKGANTPALSTDIIVGFPGETEADFEATCQLVQEVGYSQAFTFIYSKRQGTPAAKVVDATPAVVIQDRFERLVTLVQQSAWQANQGELGQTVEVLVEGTSKRDANMLTGRSPKNQTVHAPAPAGVDSERLCGRILKVQVTEARTWYLRGELV
ncbi:MAG: tRNA (N6-isopentenyl adenosine(37)-C2)-methylthiotransferase MiaB [Actinomycetia bacterium]|nr:tRNA (N6-isopentenyl adenosine(37)-C2)-methylthiotransferase MiaB [Actinomycetes bacterium]